MKGSLLDTNIALLALAAPERISPRVRRAVEDGPVYLSVISYWEIILKSSKGKLDVGDPRAWWVEALEKLAAAALPLRADHLGELAHLEPIHSDPFDRALIAQALVENLSIVTTDDAIPKYASHRLRVII